MSDFSTIEPRTNAELTKETYLIDLIRNEFIELFDEYPLKELTYQKIWDTIDKICMEIEDEAY